MTPIGPPALALGNRLFQQAWPSQYTFFQLAFVVDDLHDAALHWGKVFAIGPFYVLKRAVAQVIYRGQASIQDVQIAVAQAGPMQIELIEQKTEGPTLYRDVYAKGQAGVHHMATVVKDFDAARDHYLGLGYEIACELTGSAMRVAYFDLRRDFGLMVEVVEEQPGFLDSLARIAEACAGWDGTDPLRILTRDGYRLPDLSPAPVPAS